MNKEFVNYNSALALKELGFDEESFGHYRTYGKNLFYATPIARNLPARYRVINAPLYQQAFRWLREKYKLVAYPQWRIDNTWDITIQQLDGHGLLSGQATLSVIKKSTYEEAEQACLDKLIEIVKKNAYI